MCCADCDYRQRDYCCLLDDAVNLYNSCFMDTSKGDIEWQRINDL